MKVFGELEGSLELHCSNQLLMNLDAFILHPVIAMVAFSIPEGNIMKELSPCDSK